MVSYFAGSSASTDVDEDRVQLGEKPNVRVAFAGTDERHDYVPFMRASNPQVGWSHSFRVRDSGVVEVSVTKWRREDATQHDWLKVSDRTVRYYSPSFWAMIDGAKDQAQPPTKAPKSRPAAVKRKQLGSVPRPEGSSGLPTTRPDGPRGIPRETLGDD
jgi:hypothetical protein